MNFKDNIKRIRKENNLSQEALAEKLNVSRQAVSKWESGLAYPEMDKVVQICKMFNINIDELLNQNINEVKKDKESKSVVNKYIDDFLGFCTKTINMFSSMKFGQIVKCIIEQLIIIFVLGLLIQIFGGLLSSLFNSILSIFPQKAFTLLNNIFEGIYTFVMWALAVVILIHVFKTRYLDYFVVLDSEEKKEENEEQPEEVKAEEIKISDLQGKKFIKRKEKNNYKRS